MNWLVKAEKFEQLPISALQLLSYYKGAGKVPISFLGLFQDLWVRLKAYGMDCQLGAASVQTIDLVGQAITFWSLWWDAASWRVTLLSYVTLSHFYIFPLLNIG